MKMTERIDHATEARRMAAMADGCYGVIDLRNGEMSVAQMIEAQTLAHVAQVHATLAMAEQQRIANVIALGGEGWENNEAIRAILLTGDKLRPEIREALGL